MDRQLLNDTIDRRGQPLEICPLLRLDQVLRKPARLLFGLGEIVGERMPVLSFALAACFENCGRGGFSLAQVAFLDAEIFLLLDQRLEDFVLGQL